jgi:hypothetical protein
MTDEFRDDRMCFVCGEKNPVGLRLRLRTDPERGESIAEVTFPGHFQGWAGIVHGGLLASVLDEAMIYAVGAKGFKCVTGEITVRYVLAESELLGGAGNQVARASGKLFKIPAEPRDY